MGKQTRKSQNIQKSYVTDAHFDHLVGGSTVAVRSLLRQLEFKKNNYGPTAEDILLRWNNGVYVLEQGLVGASRSAIVPSHA
jgi:hypothetical protein